MDLAMKEKTKNKRIHFRRRTLLIVFFLIGLSIWLYPVLSNVWNEYRAKQLITQYNETVSSGESADYEAERQRARAYNAGLVGGSVPDAFAVRDGIVDEEYESLLDVTGTGIMGYIEIPVIQVSLPIYHYTTDESLQKGIGHLNGSSLPVGGEGTHAVLTGHRGLPSAKLFSDLNLLEEGDFFYLKILDETLVYEVDQIQTVLPEETDSLAVSPDEDLCTLITCTPYGINTHRLLVRGHRVSAEEVDTDTAPEIRVGKQNSTRNLQLLSTVGGVLIAVIVIYILKRIRRKSR